MSNTNNVKVPEMAKNTPSHLAETTSPGFRPLSQSNIDMLKKACVKFIS